MTELPPPVAVAIRDLILAGERFRHVMAAHAGVGVSETMVLSYLGSADGQLTPREIGERTMMTSGTLSAVLDRLETADMVTRTRNPDDRRSVLVNLMPAGRRAMAYAAQHMIAAVAAAFDGEASTRTVSDISRVAASIESVVQQLQTVTDPVI